jgi:hypothetical protein
LPRETSKIEGKYTRPFSLCGEFKNLVVSVALAAAGDHWQAGFSCGMQMVQSQEGNK